MRTQATQTDVNRQASLQGQQASSNSRAYQMHLPPARVSMISEGVQTNGYFNQQSSSPSPLPTTLSNLSTFQQYNVVPRSYSSMPPARPIPPHVARQLPGYKLQVYHLDGGQQQQQQDINAGDPNSVGLPPPSSFKPKTARSMSSGTVLVQQQQQQQHQQHRQKHHHHHHHHHHHKRSLHKSASEGASLDHDRDQLPAAEKPEERGGHGEGHQQGQQEVQQQQQQQQHLGHGHRAHRQAAVTSDEDDEDDLQLSDRDLPELVPITMSSSSSVKCQQHRREEEEEEEQRQRQISSLSKNIATRDLEKVIARGGGGGERETSRREVTMGGRERDEEEEDDDDDIGKKLSPLGSNSSIQDFIEPSSTAVGGGGGTAEGEYEDDDAILTRRNVEEDEVGGELILPARRTQERGRMESIAKEEEDEKAVRDDVCQSSSSCSSATASDKNDADDDDNDVENVKLEAFSSGEILESKAQIVFSKKRRSADKEVLGQHRRRRSSEQQEIHSADQSGERGMKGEEEEDDEEEEDLTDSASNLRSPSGLCQQKQQQQEDVISLQSGSDDVAIKSPLHDVSIGSSSSGSYSVTTETNNEKGSRTTGNNNNNHKHQQQQQQPQPAATTVCKGGKEKDEEDEINVSTGEEGGGDTLTLLLEEESSDLLPRDEEKKAAAASSKLASGELETSNPISDEDNSKLKRKQELTLDLLLREGECKPAATAASAEASDTKGFPTSATTSRRQQQQEAPTTSPTATGETTSENNTIWQRVPMGGGDVMKKRKAFEDQIKAQSPSTTPSASSSFNGKGARTPSSAVTRRIVSEEIASSSSSTAMGGGSSMARSPAMHEGFRAEDWVVKRTPVNTPAASSSSSSAAPPLPGDDDEKTLVVEMINLSDEEKEEENEEEEEDETSMHIDSEAAFKSGATTSPVESVQSSTQDLVKPAAKTTTTTPPQQQQKETRRDKPDEPCAPEPPRDLPLVEPPAGFGDSPERKNRALPGYQSPLSEQQEVSEELLIAEQMSTPKRDHAPSSSSITTPSSVPKHKESSSVAATEAGGGLSSATTTPTPTVTAPPSSSASGGGVDRGGKARRKSKSRSRSGSKERLLSNLAEAESAPRTPADEDEVTGLYLGGYKRSVWAFIGKLHPSQAAASENEDASASSYPIRRSASIESTQSEREFKKRHQAITHRMVHRKSSAVMYSKILERTFECNKSVVVARVRGEFGFRIHGSRPVVVSAIEPDTPAESSGLEVGDIILTINGVNVLDLPHTEVVKTAQTGRDELELGLAHIESDEERKGIIKGGAINQAMDRLDSSLRLIHFGYMWKLSSQSSTKAKGGGDVMRWNRRWFVLRADSCLYFFKTEHETRPLGAILLSSGKVQRGCPRDPSRLLSFTVIWPSSSSSPHGSAGGSGSVCHSALSLAAENREEESVWASAIAASGKASDEVDLWMDLARRRMAFFPTEISLGADCSGHLVKLDGRSKMWKRRFCVLIDACLFLYVDEEATAALAALCLHGYRIQSVGSLGGHRRHAFELIPPSADLKYFYFVAETETEKKRWLASLEYSMDQWMKLSEEN